MEIQGSIPFVPMKKTVKVNAKQDGTGIEIIGDCEMPRDQVIEAFGDEFSETAFCVKRTVKDDSGEDQIQYPGAVRPDSQDFKLGSHEITIDKLEFTAKPDFCGAITGITGTDRVIIPLRLKIESSKASKFFEANMGNKTLTMEFRSVEEEDVQDPLPGTNGAGKTGTLNFDNAAPATVQ